ncbi:50S ribosomal protein L15 [Acuticoccus yangtzensis]|uniref:50S ribosomal protein L15 n=1 Tax=Acuticoccus yangtzensis TaxID=1443441 RepID=UPI00094958D0|nr:50S ribosomal protein L15 [Acuticoccus yangtzensis]ORE94571.1 50S ribosomal protein L15 [Stappia sp. 22II-S9-Z10]
MKLNELRDNPGATKARKRVGRGIGSGTGKTGGRGVKGQKSRSGVAIKGFEGGQMPLHMRLPKRGFNNIFRPDYNIIAVGKLQAAVDAGRVDPSQPVTAESLAATGILRRAKDGVRILADGELNTALNLKVAGISKAAREIVEKAGGSVEVLAPKKVETAAE